jgi:hypothetical protein
MQMRLSRGIGAWCARRRCMTKSLAGLVHLAAGSRGLGDVDCSGPAPARCSPRTARGRPGRFERPPSRQLQA